MQNFLSSIFLKKSIVFYFFVFARFVSLKELPSDTFSIAFAPCICISIAKGKKNCPFYKGKIQKDFLPSRTSISSPKKSAILHKFSKVISLWQCKYLDMVCCGMPTFLENSFADIFELSINSFKFSEKTSITVFIQIFYTVWRKIFDFTPNGVI